MKKILFIIFFLVVAVMATKAVAEEEKIVIVGGWGGNDKQLEFLKKEIPGSIIVMNNVATSFVPTGDVSEQVKILEDKMKDLGIEKATFVAHSYGGLVVREFARKHPEAVEKIILIGTPNGGYKNWSFGKGSLIDRDIPIYVVAGNKSSKKWYLADDNNDGTVDVSSLYSIPISDARMFQLDHVELIHSKEVTSQINAWLE